MKQLLRSIMIACLGLTGATAFAGGDAPVLAAGLDVNPVRITLSKQQAIAAITVNNRASEPSVIQVEIVRWDQGDGQDRYHPTRKLLVNPPVFTIAPGGSQIVRVGLNSKVDKTRELAYRVYLQEVPPPAAPEFAGLRMALRLGLPVFVLPDAAAKSTLNWDVKRGTDGTFKVAVTNTGNAHARIQDIKLTTQREAGRVIAAQSAHAYLFPGQSAHWTLKPTWDWFGKRAVLCVLSDQGLANTDIEVE